MVVSHILFCLTCDKREREGASKRTTEGGRKKERGKEGARGGRGRRRDGVKAKSSGQKQYNIYNDISFYPHSKGPVGYVLAGAGGSFAMHEIILSDDYYILSQRANN